MKDKSLYTTSLHADETACNILDRLIEKYKKDKKAGRIRKFLVREFSVEESFDREGSPIPSSNFQLNVSIVDKMMTEKKKSPHQRRQTNAQAKGMEIAIGAPHLVYPKIDKSKILPKPKSDVIKCLEKWRSRAQAEMKALRELCDTINECQNERIVSAIETLHWVLTQYTEDGINQMGMSNILDHLFILTVRKERDKLFYVRRHPDDLSLHKCQNQGLLTSIEQIEWVLGCNPLSDAHQKMTKELIDKGIGIGNAISTF